MLFAYYVHDLSPFLVQIGPHFGIRWYGLSYVLGFLVGIALCKHLARKGYSDIAPEAVTDFIVWGAIFGVVLGGRIGYMLFYRPGELAADPLAFFRVWEGGMASHGGIIGLALYVWWYARRHHVSWRNLSDNLCVVAPLGLAFGRFANFINGELYGRATTVPWAMQFPKETFERPDIAAAAIKRATAINPAWNTVDVIETASRSEAALRAALAEVLTPRHPSQLYQAGLEGLLLFALLWILRTRVRLPNGVLTAVFFIAYAVLRSVGEVFREPDAPLTGPFTRGQFLSIFLVIAGVVLLVIAWRRPKWPPRWSGRAA